MKDTLYIDPELSAQMRIVAQKLEWAALKPDEKLRAVDMDFVRKLQDHIDALRQSLLEHTMSIREMAVEAGLIEDSHPIYGLPTDNEATEDFRNGTV